MTSQQIEQINNKILQLQNQVNNLTSTESLDYQSLNAQIGILSNLIPYRVINTTSINLQQYNTPNNIDTIFVTMVGAGGAGGYGIISGGTFYGGGGGGCGEMIFRYPVNIHGTIATIQTICGTGGNNLNSNGGNTLVTIFINQESNNVVHLSAQGGFGGGSGITNTGGPGAISTLLPIFNGQNGQNGQIVLPSFGNTTGGNGGNSWFGKGGPGGNTYSSLNNENNMVFNPQGLNGSYGSGGGGSCPGLDPSLIGYGGNGFIMIEW